MADEDLFGICLGHFASHLEWDRLTIGAFKIDFSLHHMGRRLCEVALGFVPTRVRSLLEGSRPHFLVRILRCLTGTCLGQLSDITDG